MPPPRCRHDSDVDRRSESTAKPLAAMPSRPDHPSDVEPRTGGSRSGGRHRVPAETNRRLCRDSSRPEKGRSGSVGILNASGYMPVSSAADVTRVARGSDRPEVAVGTTAHRAPVKVSAALRQPRSPPSRMHDSQANRHAVGKLVCSTASRALGVRLPAWPWGRWRNSAAYAWRLWQHCST